MPIPLLIAQAALMAGQAVMSGIGSINQARAASMQADLARRAAAIRSQQIARRGAFEVRRNRLIQDVTTAQIAAAMAGRGVSSSTGSAEDLRRASVIASAMNEAAIRRNIGLDLWQSGMGYASAIQDARNQRAAALGQAFGAFFGAATNVTGLIGDEMGRD